MNAIQVARDQPGYDRWEYGGYVYKNSGFFYAQSPGTDRQPAEIPLTTSGIPGSAQLTGFYHNHHQSFSLSGADKRFWAGFIVYIDLDGETRSFELGARFNSSGRVVTASGSNCVNN